MRLLLFFLLCSCETSQDYPDQTILLPEAKRGKVQAINHYKTGWRYE